MRSLTELYVALTQFTYVVGCVSTRQVHCRFPWLLFRNANRRRILGRFLPYFTPPLRVTDVVAMLADMLGRTRSSPLLTSHVVRRYVRFTLLLIQSLDMKRFTP